jgi:aminoglycoside 3-N-acetyltransferase
LNNIDAIESLKTILNELNICSGDCIMLGIDMSNIPLPSYKAELNINSFREREDKWHSFILKSLIEQIGTFGTLLVPTYTYSYTKPGSIYYSNDAKSEVGSFTEYFRKQPKVIRSLHPIFSIAGIGKYAKDILTLNSTNAFGIGSPFSRFEEYNVKFLCLGVELKKPLTFVHHLEQNFGVYHRFNKRFEVEVYENNHKVEGDWTALVAYRGIEYKSDLTSLQVELINTNKLKENIWNGNYNHMAEVKDIIISGYKLLMKDSLSFVNRNFKFNFDDNTTFNKTIIDQSHLIITVKDI